MSKPDGGPAFPSPWGSGGGVQTLGGARRPDPVGMSLRDWFAAKSLTQWDVLFAGLFSAGWAAYIAYSRADAMLAERAK